MSTSRNGVGSGSTVKPVLDAYSAVAVLLLIIIAIAAWRHFDATFAIRGAGTPLTTVEPNLVPWWELTVLPRIGETKARQIVTYRETPVSGGVKGRTPPAFRTPGDLARVRGIGPKTVTRIAPYLRFESKRSIASPTQDFRS